ncbi:CD48 antigen-like [Nerophis lumbriciformis]|uniref:CD48 antigen-like n=1 Tax=Nerophis lumbriciformis TaxID=546530 RepID=UPI003BAD78B9
MSDFTTHGVSVFTAVPRSQRRERKWAWPVVLSPLLFQIKTSISAQDVKYFLKGQDIHLMPSISERPIRIFWQHNENDVVYFTGTADYVSSSYKNRITLDRVSAELTIKNATYEDSGVYHLEMNINSEQDTFLCTIEVIDKVSKPNISCEMSDTKQATLVCSTESKHPHLLKFKWSSAGKEQTGPKLTITVRNEDDDQVYRCDVSNPLTNEKASFTAKDCFLGKRSDAHLIFMFVCIFILCAKSVMKTNPSKINYSLFPPAQD